MGAYLTRFGSMFGTVPAFTGRVYFVAPASTYYIDGKSYSASDNNDGLAPERALATVTRAVTLTSADTSSRTSDAIVLLEGAHTVTSTVAPKIGTRIYGSHPVYGGSHWKPRTSLSIRGTNDELLDLAAGDIEIAFLTLIGTADYSSVSFQTTNAINGINIHDCYFDLNSNATYTVNHRAIDFGNRVGGQGISRIAAAAATALATAYIWNCTFETSGAAGEAIHFATCDVVVKNCRFNTTAGTWATPVQYATNGFGMLQDNLFTSSGGTMTVAVSGYHAGYAVDITEGARLYDNRITGSLGTAATAAGVAASPFLNFGTNAVSMSENYAASRGSTFANGGALVTRAN